jgi:hypothetical protein
MSSVARVTLRCPAEAAEALGVSPDYFDEHVRPELKLIRRGPAMYRKARMSRILQPAPDKTARGASRPAPQVFASSGVCSRESERLDGWEPQPNRRGLTAARTPFA